jgi:hypothetical protein
MAAMDLKVVTWNIKCLGGNALEESGARWFSNIFSNRANKSVLLNLASGGMFLNSKLNNLSSRDIYDAVKDLQKDELNFEAQHLLAESKNVKNSLPTRNLAKKGYELLSIYLKAVASDNIGSTKVGIIGQILQKIDFDILFIVELRKSSSASAVLKGICKTLNAINQHNYDFYTSYATGLELYGVIIKNDPNIIPLFPKKSGNKPLGHYYSINNLDNFTFTPNQNNAYKEKGQPAKFPLIDLQNISIIEETDVMKNKKNTKVWVNKGPDSIYKNKFRKPCLVPFLIYGKLIPFVVLHLKSGQERGTKYQIHRIKGLHICQKYFPIPNKDLDIDGTNYSVDNIVITGDFNLDFRRRTQNGTWKYPWESKVNTTLNNAVKYYEHISPKFWDKKPPLKVDPPLKKGYDKQRMIQVNNGNSGPDMDIDCVYDLPLHFAIPSTKTIYVVDYVQNNKNYHQLFRDFMNNNWVDKTTNKKTTAAFDNIVYGGKNIKIANVNAYKVEDLSKFIYSFKDGPIVPKTKIDFSPLIQEAMGSARDIFLQHFDEEVFQKYLDKKNRDIRQQTHPLQGGLTPPLDWEKIVIARLVSDHLPVTVTFKVQ